MSNFNTATPDTATSTATYILVGVGIFVGLILFIIILWAIISAARSNTRFVDMPGISDTIDTVAAQNSYVPTQYFVTGVSTNETKRRYANPSRNFQ